MYLGTHQYDIVHRSEDFQGHVDGLSRLTLPNSEDEEEDNIFLLEVDEYITLASKDVESESAKDSVILEVIPHTLNGWSNFNYNAEMKPF